MQDHYGNENTYIDGGMEALVDSIDDMIGSPPAADEGYDYGYVNILRMLCHIACIQGF